MRKQAALLLALVLFMPALLSAQTVRQDSPPAPGNRAASPTLAERLGFKATDIILIVNGDDVGMSHAANAATIDAMENGLMTSGTIMVPCPWFAEIAAYAKAHPDLDFGLHLTHTSEWKGYKWGPVASKSEVPGLVDPQGYLWPDILSVYKNSTPEQAEIEARAQIKKALAAGIDVTHIDSHMGALQYNLQYHEVYRRLAKEFDLPLRMGSQELLAAQGGGHLRAQLDADGVIYPDYLIHGMRKKGEPVADYWKRMLNGLKPGVTELYIHAALAGEEMKHITNSWQERADEHHLFTKDEEVRRILEAKGVKRIGYRALRDLQRKSRSGAQKSGSK
ncbi:MAG TPA: polysaccharide deacetylase family protein [Blastocatellia bacterium]|nr:polysaccharide deacetylase family protein [Blastocatellia bacterium]